MGRADTSDTLLDPGGAPGLGLGEAAGRQAQSTGATCWHKGDDPGPGERPGDSHVGASRRTGRCQVRVLPPVPTEGLTPDDVPALADGVRHSMLTVFQDISSDSRGGGDCLKTPGVAGEARL